jgi:hypothetical protein
MHVSKCKNNKMKRNIHMQISQHILKIIWVSNKEIIMTIRKYLELNDNENIIYRNIRAADKVISIETALNVDIRK